MEKQLDLSANQLPRGTKTAYDLLMSAPDDQVTRCKIAHRAIAAGEWKDAAFTLKAAAAEASGEWANDARALAAFCDTAACRHLASHQGEQRLKPSLNRQYPTEPGWYCLGFDRLDPHLQADIGPSMEGIYHFTGEHWLDESGDLVEGVYDPELGVDVSMSAADYYVRS
ncbi:hypothetical protein [Achromobacter insolitus]|uniref:hypothetical protein n=1 Tax=Achromobacter insolitus TaxID=217204 RepID=UPI0007C544B5|nr:hypothetical protein [Achromobacter insolitus]